MPWWRSRTAASTAPPRWDQTSRALARISRPGEARGKGVGTALCRYALDWAREHGYAGMQFNAVVETNVSAVEIYKRLGFTVIGTVPGAFEHPVQGRVGLHIMFCPL